MQYQNFTETTMQISTTTVPISSKMSIILYCRQRVVIKYQLFYVFITCSKKSWTRGLKPDLYDGSVL